MYGFQYPISFSVGTFIKNIKLLCVKKAEPFSVQDFKVSDGNLVTYIVGCRGVDS